MLHDHRTLNSQWAFVAGMTIIPSSGPIIPTEKYPETVGSIFMEAENWKYFEIMFYE